jgi:hypothetical protein
VKPLDAYDKAYETGVFFTDSDTEWWLFSPVPKRKIAKNVSNGNELSRYNAKSIVLTTNTGTVQSRISASRKIQVLEKISA